MAGVLYTIFIYPLELLFEVLFNVANDYYDNPAISIVVLSLCINLLLLPLYSNADKLQKKERDLEASIADGTAHIKKAFKGDERMMILQTYYRQNNYSPFYVFKDSVPLLLQIPFFITAYRFLSGLEILNNASLGPITSLGVPDGLLAVAGTHINVLPILMTLINLISGWIYSKGIPLKSKIQMYLLALVFLVLLYDSPSGLVFYWTLNNVFSLGKNIVIKLSEGKLKKTSESEDTNDKSKSYTGVFLLSGLILTILVGLLIPSGVIVSSTADFINFSNLKTPNTYIVRSGFIALGCFLVWGGIFYGVASKTGRKIISHVWLSFVFISLITYLYFGTDHGLLTRTLAFQKVFENDFSSVIINLLVCIAVSVIVILLSRYYRNVALIVLLVISIACTKIVIDNMTSIENNYTDTVESLNFDIPSYNLSTLGNNVMVIMLDRACGYLVPYIFDELPYLQDEFDGFTFYPNTVSFGSYTKTGSPALFGGYDYTPQNIVADTETTLREMQNNALSVMPLLFRDEGYEVTVCDPPYAGYQQIPDTTVFDQPGYEGINAYITMNNPYFDDCDYYGQQDIVLNRDLFCYSLMKVCPLMFQGFLYDNGRYWGVEIDDTSVEYTIPQVITDVSHAVGVDQEAMNNYEILRNLPSITNIVDDDTDTFMYITNKLTHSPMLFQEPFYTPAQTIDNSDYEYVHSYLFDDSESEPLFDIYNVAFYTHYESNAAAYVMLGQYFDYMRQMGVWDNTRIIIVADHSTPLLFADTTIPNCADGFGIRIDGYNPVLMVKDFGATGFTINDEVITNADVPYIAVNGLIDNPVNPFTENPIIPLTQYEGVICAYDSWDVNVITDTGADGDAYRFVDGYWFCFDGTDVLDRSSWYMIAYG